MSASQFSKNAPINTTHTTDSTYIRDHEIAQKLLNEIESMELKEKELKIKLIELVLNHHNEATDQKRIVGDVEKLWEFVKSK